MARNTRARRPIRAPAAPQPEPPKLICWAVLDAHNNLTGYSDTPIEGAPGFDHQPDCAPGLYWWDAEQGAFRSSLEPITKYDAPEKHDRFLKAAIVVREQVERGEITGKAANSFAHRFDRNAAKLDPDHPVNKKLAEIRMARGPRGRA